MIREFVPEDLDRVMELWLESNIQAHNFIDSSYWEEKYDFVRVMIPEADLWVYEEAGFVVGFIGMVNDTIAGIFVDEAYRSQGIGKKLLDYQKTMQSKLSLNVYAKNTKAYEFYKRQNFYTVSEDVKDHTNECEISMEWDQSLLRKH